MHVVKCLCIASFVAAYNGATDVPRYPAKLETIKMKPFLVLLRRDRIAIRESFTG